MRAPVLLLGQLAVLGQLGFVNGAAVDGRAAAPKPCDIAQSVLTKFRGSAVLSSACNSLFGTPTPPSTTATTTSTKTIIVAPPRVTRTITKSKTTTITYLEILYNFETTTVYGGVVTDYDTINEFTTTTVTSSYGNAKRDALEPRATPEPLINGVPKPIVSTACSCLFPSPTAKTVTVTATTTVTKGKAETVKTTTTDLAYDYVVVFTATTSDTVTSTTYSTTTIPTTYTETASYITCLGTNPTPSFALQFVDTEPTRTDKFNLKYATQTPDTYTGGTAYAFEVADTATGAAKYNIDCAGRLVSRAQSSANGVVDYYASITYFFPDFDVVVLREQKSVVLSGFFFVKAEVRGEYLYVYADNLVGRLDVLLTVPEYYDEQYPFVALADAVEDEPPYRVPVKFKKIG